MIEASRRVLDVSFFHFSRTSHSVPVPVVVREKGILGSWVRVVASLNGCTIPLRLIEVASTTSNDHVSPAKNSVFSEKSNKNDQ